MLDLLIIDIDDMFIYHRTVAIANRIFVDNFYKFFYMQLNHNERNMFLTTKKAIILCLKTINPKIRIKYSKKLFILSFSALILHIINSSRNIINSVYPIISNQKMISFWAKTVKKLDIKVKNYDLTPNAVEININKEIMRYYDLLRKKNPKMKIIGISQNFAVKNTIKSTLNLDEIYSNLFYGERVIQKSQVNVKNGSDKLKIAKNYIKKGNFSQIGLFIEDYDDLELLKLKGIRYIVAHKRLKRFIDNEKFMITSGPKGFIIAKGG